jgi:hypothetical protein
VSVGPTPVMSAPTPSSLMMVLVAATGPSGYRAGSDWRRVFTKSRGTKVLWAAIEHSPPAMKNFSYLGGAV